jgi:hypothetical protein
MFSIDTDDAVGTPPAKPAVGTPGYFRSKNPAAGIIGTRLPAWYLNMLQAELMAVLDLAGIAPDKADDGQLADAIQAIALATGGGRVVSLQDQKASGTDGGTFTAGSWVDRAVAEISDVWSLGSVTGGVTIGLSPGTWEFEIAAPAYRCGTHQARLYNVTDEAVVAVGQSAISPISDDASTVSHIAGVLTIAGLSWKSFKIQHRCGTTRATDGLGKACSFGTEVYTQAVFRRLSAA